MNITGLATPVGADLIAVVDDVAGELRRKELLWIFSHAVEALRLGDWDIKFGELGHCAL